MWESGVDYTGRIQVFPKDRVRKAKPQLKLKKLKLAMDVEVREKADKRQTTENVDP